jgi:hypothetical protein
MSDANSRPGFEAKMKSFVAEEHITLFAYWCMNPTKKLKQVRPFILCLCS